MSFARCVTPSAVASILTLVRELTAAVLIGNVPVVSPLAIVIEFCVSQAIEGFELFK